MDTHATQAANGSTTLSVDTLNVVAISTEMSSNEDIAKNEDRCDKGMKREEERAHQVDSRFWTDDSVTASKCDVVTEVEEERLVQKDINVTSQSERNKDVTTSRENYCDGSVNQSNVTVDFESVATLDKVTEDYRIVYTSTKELQVPAYPNEDTASMRISVVEDKALIKSSLDDTSELHVNQSTSEGLSTCVLESSVNTTSGTSSTRTIESHSREQANTSVQRHKSSLEKLLSLFQHPGQFFSDSASTAANTRSSLQENVSGVMALGDRLQQYLKDNRTKMSTDNSWSSEPGSLLRNRSVRVNVSQLQSLTNIFASFKLEPHASLVEQSTKLFGQAKSQNTNVKEKDLEQSAKVEVAKIDEKDLSSQEKSQIARNDDKNLISQNSGESSCCQEQNRIVKDDEKNLIVQEKTQIIGNDEHNLSVEENNQIERNDEQKSFDRVMKDDEENLIKEESQALNDESNLFNQVKNQIVERDLADQEIEQVARSIDESFEHQEKTQVTEDGQNVENQRRDEVVSDNEHDLNNQKKISARNSENLEDQDNGIARKNEKDSIDVQNMHINKENVKEVRCADQLQWTESDFSDRLLPESVQSKDDFVNNLVLDGGYVEPDVTVSSSLASKSTVCIAVELTDVAGYSALELSKTDSTGCNDDFISDDAQDSEHMDRNDVEHLKCDNLKSLECDGIKVLKTNDTECLEYNVTGGANALTARTCDTTTDSINQTSDSNFPICNIGHDRKTVDNVSTTRAANTDDDVGTIKYTLDNYGKSSASLNDDWVSSMLVDDVETSARSLKDVDSDNHLSEEVTSSTCCVVDQDCQCESTKREEEERGASAEILDDVCRDSADRKSTSVNINIESRESVTTSSESQEAFGKHHEGQSFMPNNVNVHRTVLKDSAKIEEQPEDAVDDGRRIDPTILVTPYEMSTNLDKSDAEELIFCMTDVSTDGTSVEDELSPSVPSRNSPNDGAKVTESYFELSASRTTSTSTLLIENPEGIHRNSQDSGIEESALTIDDAVVGTVDAHPLPPPRSSLQESVDSGIESECSSICIREPAAERTLEVVVVPKRPPRDDNGVGDDNDEYGEFASDFLAREAQLVDSDSVNDDVAHSYLNNIKCTVISTARPVADEDVAHSPAVVHGTR